jgi:hypothetical protein
MIGSKVRGASLVRTRWAAVGAAVAVSLGAGGIGWANASTAAPSMFHAVSPVRVFDTRDGTGGVPAAPVTAGGSIDVAVGGTSGIPVDATAVVLNVTAVNGTAPSYLTVWPTGDVRPTASALNWSGAAATPNAVTVGLGAAGKVSFYNFSGTVNVLADVVGYFTAAGGPAAARMSFFKVPTKSIDTSNAWVDDFSTTVVLPAGDVLARFGAESYCGGVSWCSVRILLDGVEMTGGSESSFAFDDSDASSSWEAHMMERFAGGVTAGTHTVTVQMQLVGSGAGQTFRLDDATLTVSAIG